MKLAIMQPYFFPYIGYYQLVNSVERFIFLDDVDYIRRGWINRNRIFSCGSEIYITIPVVKASINTKINEIKISNTLDWRRKNLQRISQAYRKCPHYKQAMDVVESVFYSSEESLSDVAKNSIKFVFKYLGLDVDFKNSSDMSVFENKAQARIIFICKIEKASIYVNAPGGRHLYNPATFQDNNIDIRFLNVMLSEYPQFSDYFHPGLSMIDVMMFNSPGKIRKMLAAAQI